METVVCVSLLKTVSLYHVAPNEKMKEVLRRTVSEAKAAISKVCTLESMHVCKVYVCLDVCLHACVRACVRVCVCVPTQL